MQVPGKALAQVEAAAFQNPLTLSPPWEMVTGAQRAQALSPPSLTHLPTGWARGRCKRRNPFSIGVPGITLPLRSGPPRAAAVAPTTQALGRGCLPLAARTLLQTLLGLSGPAWGSLWSAGTDLDHFSTAQAVNSVRSVRGMEGC